MGLVAPAKRVVAQRDGERPTSRQLGNFRDQVKQFDLVTEMPIDGMETGLTQVESSGCWRISRSKSSAGVLSGLLAAVWVGVLVGMIDIVTACQSLESQGGIAQSIRLSSKSASRAERECHSRR